MSIPDFKTVIDWFVDHEMKECKPICMEIFLIIARYTYGHWISTKPVHIDTIINHLKSSLRTVRAAIKELEKIGIIKAYRTSGGRGKKSEYCINHEYLKLCKNNTSL